MTALISEPAAITAAEPSCLTTSDRQFLEGLGQSVRSQADFLLALLESNQSPEAAEAAASVLVWHGGEFVSVCELVEVCSSHGWNATIYEAWLWETGNRVRELQADVDPVSADALEVYARSQQFFEVSKSEMWEALDEARRALEGEPSYREFDSEAFNGEPIDSQAE